MANTEPEKKRTFVHTEYKEGNKYHQILLNEVKKDRLYRSGKPNLSEANRRIVLRFARLEQENKELKDKLRYVEDYASGKREQELHKRATNFDFHNKCYDMLLVEGDPNARECISPPSSRPVQIPRDKKTGKYIVRDPRICGRCLAMYTKHIAIFSFLLPF